MTDASKWTFTLSLAWSEDEREVLAAAIAEYKELRPFLAGHRSLLTGPLHQDWDVWQFVLPGAGRIAVLAFRDGGQVDEIRARPRAGGPDLRYVIRRVSEDRIETISGAELSDRGIAISRRPRASELL